MHRRDVDRLDPARDYWVPAVVSPRRDWTAAPGCRRGARYLVDSRTRAVTREEFETFDCEFSCRRWIRQNQAALARDLPGAEVRAVPLGRWLLGLE
ncbi:hypothetical protein [Roseomonas sp. USHLN139]|uniref:hypothetical protein n=1 Tax=Roseomonas sp. USHLN139 TaxID=3081298 RepID=UPI003B029E9D